MASEEEGIVFSEVSLSDSGDIDIGSDIIQDISDRIKHSAISPKIQHQLVEISSHSPQEHSLQLFSHFEDHLHYREDEDSSYQPEAEISQPEADRIDKNYNTRSKDFRFITKQQFITSQHSQEPQRPPNHTVIDVQPQEPPNLPVKVEGARINLKEEMRAGAITKKTKIQFLMKRHAFIRHKAKTMKIQKQLKKLARELA